MPSSKMNLVASLQTRIKNQARQSGVPFATLLEQFALGRFFARLVQSKHAEQFVLKGAQLFRFWSAESHRPTRDADFLSFGANSPEALDAVFRDICAIVPAQEDGLGWENIQAEAIRDENAYGGVRVLITGKLGNIRIPLQFDVGFGDAVTPDVLHQQWPSFLDYPEVRLAAYPMETVIAEKLEAAVSLGINNSRMKDFYDIHWLLNHLNFDGEVLTEAILNTFQRRSTDLPAETPLALSGEFAADIQKQSQWNAFLKKGKLPAQELDKVIQSIALFLLPVLNQQVSSQTWSPKDAWHPTPPLP